MELTNFKWGDIYVFTTGFFLLLQFLKQYSIMAITWHLFTLLGAVKLEVIGLQKDMTIICKYNILYQREESADPRAGLLWVPEAPVFLSMPSVHHGPYLHTQ